MQIYVYDIAAVAAAAVVAVAAPRDVRRSFFDCPYKYAIILHLPAAARAFICSAVIRHVGPVYGTRDFWATAKGKSTFTHTHTPAHTRALTHTCVSLPPAALEGGRGCKRIYLLIYLYLYLYLCA